MVEIAWTIAEIWFIFLFLLVVEVLQLNWKEKRIINKVEVLLLYFIWFIQKCNLKIFHRICITQFSYTFIFLKSNFHFIKRFSFFNNLQCSESIQNYHPFYDSQHLREIHYYPSFFEKFTQKFSSLIGKCGRHVTFEEITKLPNAVCK